MAQALPAAGEEAHRDLSHLDAELSCPTTALSKISPSLSVLLARDVSMSIKKLVH